MPTIEISLIKKKKKKKDRKKKKRNGFVLKMYTCVTAPVIEGLCGRWPHTVLLLPNKHFPAVAP